MSFFKFILISLFLLIAACSNQPAEEYVDPTEAFDLTEGNKPIWSSNGAKKQQAEQAQPAVVYTPNNTGTLIPLTRKEGVLSFDDWKKAKEANSKEYQEYLEYREYLQTLQSQ